MKEFVDRLVVGVGYETDKGSIRQVMGEFRGAFNALTGYSAAILSAAAAGGVFALAQASAIDETATLAKQLRVTTEELTAAEYAATQAGVGVDKLVETMMPLDAAIARAAAGEEAAAKAFRMMGLSAYDTDGKLRTSIGSIDDIAGALAGMNDEAKKGQVLQALFGESGAKLRPLLDLGAEGVRELKLEAAELGLVLSEEAAESAHELVTATGRLRGVVRGLGWEVSDVLIPPTTRVVDGLTDWLAASDGLVRTGLDRFLRGLSWTISGLETPQGKAVAGAVALAGALGARQGLSLATAGLQAAGPLGQLIGKFPGLAGKAGLSAAALALVALAVDDIIVTAQGGDSVLRRFADSVGITEESATLFASAGDLVSTSWEVISPVLGEAGSALLKLADDLGVPIPTMETLIRDARMLATEMEKIGISLDPKGALQGYSKWFQSGAQGWRELGMWLEGDPRVEDTRVRRFNIEDVPVGPRLSPEALAVPQGGVTVNPAVSLTTGPSRDEIAREAGRAVERQVYAELDAVGYLE